MLIYFYLFKRQREKKRYLSSTTFLSTCPQKPGLAWSQCGAQEQRSVVPGRRQEPRPLVHPLAPWHSAFAGSLVGSQLLGEVRSTTAIQTQEL